MITRENGFTANGTFNEIPLEKAIERERTGEPAPRPHPLHLDGGLNLDR